MKLLKHEKLTIRLMSIKAASFLSSCTRMNYERKGLIDTFNLRVFLYTIILIIISMYKQNYQGSFEISF